MWYQKFRLTIDYHTKKKTHGLYLQEILFRFICWTLEIRSEMEPGNSLGACLALPLEFNQEKDCLFKRHNEQGVALLYWTDLPKQFIALLMIYSPKLMLSLPTIPSVYTHTKDFETIPSILGQFKENKTCKLKQWSFLSILI